MRFQEHCSLPSQIWWGGGGAPWAGIQYMLHRYSTYVLGFLVNQVGGGGVDGIPFSCPPDFRVKIPIFDFDFDLVIFCKELLFLIVVNIMQLDHLGEGGGRGEEGWAPLTHMNK